MTTPPAPSPFAELQNLDSSRLIPVISTAVILGLFLMTFFFLLLVRFILNNANQSNNGFPSPSVNNLAAGLDPLIKEIFPTFKYSAVKSHCQRKDGLECAICLSEMESKDMLRLLTVCCHVFHLDCIDEWLETHSTCPICRANLSNPEKRHTMCPLLQGREILQVINENENETLDHHDDRLSLDSIRHDQVILTVNGGDDMFPKSHSTGHSLLLFREDEDDKYRLILTEPMRAELAKGHRCAKSCTIFGDYSTNTVDSTSPNPPRQQQSTSSEKSC